MGTKRNIYRTAIGSGYFPLTFNFVKLTDGKYVQCAYCGKFIYHRRVTRDHIYPKSKGGVLKAPACMNCNEEKEDMLPIEWAVYAAKKKIDIAMIPMGAEFEFERDSLMADICLLLELLIEDKESICTAVA